MKSALQAFISGFTMLELVVVAFIVAVFALLVLPTYQNHDDHEKAVMTANQFREFASSFSSFAQANGAWPTHKSPSLLPTGMEENLPGFTETTPIGGYWDWSTAPCGTKIQIHLVEPTIGVAILEKNDFMLDDGSLDSGTMTGSQDCISMNLKL